MKENISQMNDNVDLSANCFDSNWSPGDIFTKGIKIKLSQKSAQV